MAVTVKAPLSSIIPFIVLMLLGVSVANGQTSKPQSDDELANDLRTVIILAGYQCKGVVEATSLSPSEYAVSCDADRHYRIRVSEEGKVLVDSRSDQPATTSPADADHDKLMEKHLFAIVNLAGRQCASVLSYERHGPRDSFVTCEDQTVYRIHVTPEGHVAVDKSTMDK